MISQLIQQLTGDDETQRTTARQQILALDEDAVEPLTDEFYAGVNEAAGEIILEILGEIGGWEALNVLRDTYANPRYPSWKAAAERGLAYNGQSPDID